MHRRLTVDVEVDQVSKESDGVDQAVVRDVFGGSEEDESADLRAENEHLPDSHRSAVEEDELYNSHLRPEDLVRRPPGQPDKMDLIKVSNIMGNEPVPFDPKNYVEGDIFVTDESRTTGNSDLGSDKSNPDCLSRGDAFQQLEPLGTTQDCIIGRLNIHVHHARDIHNICIYHKQDVYAKISLTNEPENIVSTKTVNGGGRSPVFNERLHLNIHNIESSLKCEIWMMSRARNYLEDQLLGFTLIPLSDVVGDMDRTQEFQLSSTDLFHSPSGYVQLSLEYIGSSPEVIVIPASTNNTLYDSENVDDIPHEYGKLEFPDMKVAIENKRMVFEYTGIPCEKLEKECIQDLSLESNDCTHTEAGVSIVESFSTAGTTEDLKKESPPNSVSINGPHATMASTSLGSSVINESQELSTKTLETDDREADYSDGQASSISGPPLINVNISEHSIVQQDIVDMYMKSMQQFTDSLAKMKLPMDIGSNYTDDEAAKPDIDKKDEPKKTGSRVFYGSRAFF